MFSCESEGRAHAVRRYRPEEGDFGPEFDRLAELAVHLFGASMAVVSLVGEGRRWFLSAHGADPASLSGHMDFCTDTLASDTPLVVPDLREDPRYADHPFVVGPPHLRFYAGAPLVTAEGVRIGTVCVLDEAPRTPTPDRIRQLRHLAGFAVQALDSRKTTLRRERDRLADLLDTLPTPVLHGVEQHGRIQVLRINPAFEATFGIHAESIVGQSLHEIMQQRGEAKRLADQLPDVDAMQGTATLCREVRYETDDGPAEFEINAAVRTAQNGQREVFAIYTDMSARKAYERQLQAARNAAQGASRLKTAVLANMSHEVRTPLTSIIGFAEVLQNDLQAPTVELATIIRRSAERLLQTLDAVLQLSRLDAGGFTADRSEVNVEATVKTVMDVMAPKAREASVSIRVDVSPHSVSGYTDAVAVHRILTNVVDNAIKFSAPGGHVHIRVREDGNAICVEVEDDGIGIANDFLPHVCQAFAQESEGIRRDYEGTGLGMTITDRLVEALGGSLHIRSKKGEGTSVAVRLPHGRVEGAAA